MPGKDSAKDRKLIFFLLSPKFHISKLIVTYYVDTTKFY